MLQFAKTAVSFGEVLAKLQHCMLQFAKTAVFLVKF